MNNLNHLPKFHISTAQIYFNIIRSCRGRDIFLNHQKSDPSWFFDGDVYNISKELKKLKRKHHVNTVMAYTKMNKPIHEKESWHLVRFETNDQEIFADFCIESCRLLDNINNSSFSFIPNLINKHLYVFVPKDKTKPWVMSIDIKELKKEHENIMSSIEV